MITVWLRCTIEGIEVWAVEYIDPSTTLFEHDGIVNIVDWSNDHGLETPRGQRWFRNPHPDREIGSLLLWDSVECCRPGVVWTYHQATVLVYTDRQGRAADEMFEWWLARS